MRADRLCAARGAGPVCGRPGRSTPLRCSPSRCAAVVLGSLLLVTWNVDQRLTAMERPRREFSVFLHDDATSEQRGAIEAAVDQSGVTAGREYVSKAQALSRFRRQFADLAALTSDLEDNPFPASLEVRVRPDAERNGRADALVKRVAGLPGVADVRYDREWLARVAAAQHHPRRRLRARAADGAAAAVTVAAVVRLGLHARRDEIEIMELVGSPVAFIRGPFIAEGLMQGGVGAVVALGLLGSDSGRARLVGRRPRPAARWRGAAVPAGSARRFCWLRGDVRGRRLAGFAASRHAA